MIGFREIKVKIHQHLFRSKALQERLLRALGGVVLEMWFAGLALELALCRGLSNVTTERNTSRTCIVSKL